MFGSVGCLGINLTKLVLILFLRGSVPDDYDNSGEGGSTLIISPWYNTVAMTKTQITLRNVSQHEEHQVIH